MNYKTYLFNKSINSISERLIRSEVYRAFGLILLKYEIILTNKIPKGAPAATDYKRIYINPESSFYTACDVNIDHISTFTIMHEISHIIFMHDKRIGCRDKILWGYATDFMINLLLDNIEKETVRWEAQQKLIVMSIKRFKDTICYNKSFESMLEEEIYDKLEKDGNYTSEKTTQSYKQFLEDVGIPSDGVDEYEDIEIEETELKLDGIVKKKTFIKFPKAKNQLDGDDEVLDTQLAKTMFETNILSRGFENSDFKKFLNRMCEVKVPWTTILQDSILIELQKSSDVSYGKPRMAWLVNPTLPYMPSYEEEEVLGDAIVSIDESASVSDNDISTAISIIQQANSYYKRLRIIKHDTKVKWENTYEDSLTEDDITELLIRRHSGGTNHRCVFEKVMEYNQDSDHFISILIVISDMYSDISKSQSIIPDSIPRIYLKTNSSDLDYDNIKGKIIKIQ